MNILRGYEIVVVKLYFCILILEKYKIYVYTNDSTKCSFLYCTHDFIQLFHTKKGVCMREKNATSIEYFKDPRRIVDLLNGIVFHGR